MNTTFHSGKSFEKEWRKQLADWKKKNEEEDKLKVEVVASYMRTQEQKRT